MSKPDRATRPAAFDQRARVPVGLSAPVVALLTAQLHQGPPQPQRFPAPDEWMAHLAGIPLLHQPGEAFTYNTAYDILDVLTARISGQPFATYVRDRILRPLAMNDTGFSYPTALTSRATTSYRTDENGTLTMVDAPDGQWASEPVFASGAGGYVSTCWRSTGCSSPAGETCYPAIWSRR